MPHVLGPLSPLHRQHTHFSELARECQLFVAIGGLPLRNAQVNGGGANDHMLKHWLEKMQANGTRFVNISPVSNDLSAVSSAQWLAVRPGTDTALLLALCYVLITESLYDSGFVASHTVGFAPYRAYLLGERDGVAKTPRWAAEIVGISEQQIISLAREMASQRTMVNISWSIQRARQGEQAYWATVALTALLGQIGTPGGGLGFGYACTNLAGAARKAFSGPVCRRGKMRLTARSRWPGWRICCCIPAANMSLTASICATPISVWSTGREATPSTITRTLTGSAKRGDGRRRWWCTSSTGPRRPSFPILCCR